MIFNGDGIAKDSRTAAAWLKLAAEAGNPVAENRLARLYLAGEGVERNVQEALRWYRRARAAGLVDAGIEEDIAKATATDDVDTGLPGVRLTKPLAPPPTK